VDKLDLETADMSWVSGTSQQSGEGRNRVQKLEKKDLEVGVRGLLIKARVQKVKKQILRRPT
jgi:hypothetical protein